MPAARAIHAFHTGTVTFPRALIVGDVPGVPSLQSLTMPILCFAIELDAGWILIDTGLAPDFASGLGWVRGAVTGLLAKTHFEPEWAFTRRLAAMGIERARILAHLQTHLDYDHTGGLPEIAAVPVYMSRAEWRHGSHPTIAERFQQRIVTRHYAGLQRIREAELRPDPRLPHAPGALEIPESGGAVAMISLPGHTVGHAGALVRLKDGGRVLLCGDACYAAEQVVDRRALGPVAKAFARDLGAALRSLDAIRRWREAERDLRVIPSHDPDTGALCANGPARIA